MSQKAIYHHDVSGKLQPREFTVLKTHADGTVDLGPEGGEARVTNCKLTAEPANGSAVLVQEDKPKEEKPKEDKPKK